MKNKRILTAAQIRCFEVLSLDQDTHKQTLMIALNFHSNMLAQLMEKERVLWKELHEIYSLDANKRYKVKSIGGDMRLVEIEDK